MKVTWRDEIVDVVRMRHITIFRFYDTEWESLLESRNGVSDFTFVRPHSELQATPKKSICLVVGQRAGSHPLYVGVVRNKLAVSTLDSRVRVQLASPIEPITFEELRGLLGEASSDRRMADQLFDGSPVRRLSKGLSLLIIENLLARVKNEKVLKNINRAIHSPGSRGENRLLQSDAISTALKIFDLPPSAKARLMELSDTSESALENVRILEDAIIEHDARSMPGLQIQDSDVSGRAVFSSGKERLEVITANKRPLEEVFGVDLIYFNKIKRSLVMVQYKMLEKEGREDGRWVYRPDGQLIAEIERMHRFLVDNPAGSEPYRLNSAAFYLKFVKRNREDGTRGIVLPLEHFEQFLDSPSAVGPGGGVRVDYDALNGHYLRQTAFVELVRSGYIGTYPRDTDALMAFVELTLQHGKSVVAAIQSGEGG